MDSLLEIMLRTLRIGLESTAIAALFGLPLGCLLGLGRFRGRGALMTLVNGMLRVPPVAVGVIVWVLLWPHSLWGGGPLSGLGWIYSMSAVILVQTLLAFPIITALTAAAVQAVPLGLLDQARAFGASRVAVAVLALREARVGVYAALLTALGTAIAAVGAVLVVAGSLFNINLAAATLATWGAGGQDGRAAALGSLLLGLFVLLAAALTAMQHRRRHGEFEAA